MHLRADCIDASAHAWQSHTSPADAQGTGDDGSASEVGLSAWGNHSGCPAGSAGGAAGQQLTVRQSACGRRDLGSTTSGDDSAAGGKARPLFRRFHHRRVCRLSQLGASRRPGASRPRTRCLGSRDKGAVTDPPAKKTDATPPSSPANTKKGKPSSNKRPVNKPPKKKETPRRDPPNHHRGRIRSATTRRKIQLGREAISFRPALCLSASTIICMPIPSRTVSRSE